MPTEVGSIYYDLDLETNNFDQKLNKSDNQAKSFGQTIGNYFGNAADASKTFAIGLGIVGSAFTGAAGYALKSAGDVELLRANFDTLLGSAEKGRKLFSDLQKMANVTPFETTDLANASQVLLSFGINAQDVLPDLQKLGDVSLGNKEKFNGLALAFGQIRARGVLMGDDLRQLIAVGFNPLQKISERTGESMASLVQKMSNGQITFDMVNSEFTKATSSGGQFFKGMDRGATTLPGLFYTVMDSVNILARGFAGLSITGDVVKDGLIDKVKNAMSELISFLSTHQDEIVGFFNSTLGWVKDNGPLIAGMITGALLPALAAITLSFAGILLELAPFIILGGALFVTWERNRPLFDAIVAGIGAIAIAVGITLIPALLSALPAVGALVLAFLPFIALGLIVGGAVYLIVSNWDWIKSKALEVRDIVINAWDSVKSSFLSIVGVIGQALSGVWLAITKPFKDAFDWVKNAVGEVIDKLKDLNPFTRHSPSLVDLVTSGTKEITKQYSSMFRDLNAMGGKFGPSISNALVGNQNTSNRSVIINQTNNVHTDMDLVAANRELGWRLAT